MPSRDILWQLLGSRLVNQMQANAIQNTVWHGLERIVATLNREQITHNLRALDIDACRLAVEHLSLSLPSFRHLLFIWHYFCRRLRMTFGMRCRQSHFRLLLSKSFPTPSSPPFPPCQMKSSRTRRLRICYYGSVLLMSSSKTAHQSQACRFLVHQLLHEFQSARFSFYHIRSNTIASERALMF